jgi:hypothetical protein
VCVYAFIARENINKLIVILKRGTIDDVIRETDSNLYRDLHNGSNLYHSNKTGNGEIRIKLSPVADRGINLENPFSSEVSLRDFGGSQQLFDKDSSLDDSMRSITPPNKKDNVYIDNLNNQQ